MSLAMQTYKAGRWQTLNVHRPGDRMGSISHHTPDGRQVYVFTTTEDKSVIRRSVFGADLEIGLMRAIHTESFEHVATLNSDNPDLEFWLRTARMPNAIRFRFHWQ